MKDWEQPANFPSMLGVYLAVNAIADAYVLVDGPDCALYKAHYIHGRHDWNSSLLNISGRHRVAFTNICSRGVVKQHDDVISRCIRTLDGLEESGLVFVTALPMCSITGVDYGRIIRGLSGQIKKPVVDIPPSSLVGDWLDGYGQALHAAARAMRWDGSKKRPGTVAFVGYLMDRNEADHRANLAELRRMVAALSLELTSVWLGGDPYSALGAARDAEFIVSLPYGRRAARLIAERAGARLIEAELPFGLPKTEMLLKQLADAADRRDQAEAFHEAEMRRIIPRLEWVFPHCFLNKRVVFVGDPHLLAGFLDVAEDTGMKMCGAVVTGRRAHGGSREGVTVLHELPLHSDEAESLLNDGIDLIVSPYFDGWSKWGSFSAPLMEFGFPSYRHHVLLERPFLGYNGFLAFVERMAESIQAGGKGNPEARQMGLSPGRLPHRREHFPLKIP